MTSETPECVIGMLLPKPPSLPGALEDLGSALASPESVSSKRLKESLSMSLKTSVFAARICLTSSSSSELRTASISDARMPEGRLISSAAPGLTKWLMSMLARTFSASSNVVLRHSAVWPPVLRRSRVAPFATRKAEAFSWKARFSWENSPCLQEGGETGAE